MVVIQRMTVADTDWLTRVGATSLLQSHGHSAPQEVMQAYLDRAFSPAAVQAELEDETNIFCSVFYNGQPAGYYKIILSKPHPATDTQPITYMERLYLLADYYDKHLGQQLMTHAVELSKAAGEKGMWLNVWKENSRALRFYEKQGFRSIGESSFVLTASHANPNWVMLLEY